MVISAYFLWVLEGEKEKTFRDSLFLDEDNYCKYHITFCDRRDIDRGPASDSSVCGPPLLHIVFIIIGFISYLIHEKFPRSSAVNHEITDSGQWKHISFSRLFHFVLRSQKSRAFISVK